MSMITSSEITEILNKVETWPAEARLQLAQKLLGTLERDVAPTAPRRKASLRDLIGILRVGDGPPPTDEEIEAMKYEAMMEKYGPL